MDLSFSFFLSSILLGVGLAMDAFAVSVCKGLSSRHASFKNMAKCGLWFGIFQGLMPLIGWFCVTTLLGLFYGAQMQSMPPKLHSKNFPGMELIRPLYCVHEDAVIAWRNYNELRFLQCACRFTEARDASEDGVGDSKRQEMKQLLRELGVR